MDLEVRMVLETVRKGAAKALALGRGRLLRTTAMMRLILTNPVRKLIGQNYGRMLWRGRWTLVQKRTNDGDNSVLLRFEL